MSHQNQGLGSGTVLLAFVAGAAVGAAVALLFAPASGSETRAYVNRRAREARDRAALASDIAEGYVSKEAGVKDYGANE